MHSEVAIFRTFHQQYVHRHFDKAFVIKKIFFFFYRAVPSVILWSFIISFMPIVHLFVIVVVS